MYQGMILASTGFLGLRGLVIVGGLVSLGASFQLTRVPLRHRREVTSVGPLGALKPSVDTSTFLAADCDDDNTPPSLAAIVRSIKSLKSGSDIRGTFVDHKRVGTLLNVYQAMLTSPSGLDKALTPFAAFCYGHAFAQMVMQHHPMVTSSISVAPPSVPSSFLFLSSPSLIQEENKEMHPHSHAQNMPSISICVGRDPRSHSTTLADSLCRGIESVAGCSAYYTNLATTPSMNEFCRSTHIQPRMDAAIMVTASHLPQEKNGFKFFANFCQGGLTQRHISTLAEGAATCARSWFQVGLVPPTSGEGGVSCSAWVDLMPFYENTIREAIRREVMTGLVSSSSSTLPLAGLRIVLNAGNGSGSFFYPLLHDLGADVSSSIHCNPQQPFPTSGVPNPEYKPMIDETIQACEASSADLGIMLDTDADRCGLIVPRTEEDSSTVRYESLNRNRLIALLSVIFSSSSPGCTVVTDSVTSQGLSTFLHNLGLKHVRYLKGYANVIGKAKELMAEMAIETSGHCAMRENGYLDDGTYTAVKVIGLLARVSRSRHDSQMSHALSKKRVGGLLNLIENLEEMPEVKELRMKVVDGTTESTDYIYRVLLPCIQDGCSGIKGWELDKENLEGIRVTVGIDGSFFMLRKSLHDPILSLQVEGESVESVRINIIQPLLHLFRVREQEDGLDVSKVIQLDALRAY